MNDSLTARKEEMRILVMLEQELWLLGWMKKDGSSIVGFKDACVFLRRAYELGRQHERAVMEEQP